MLSDNKNGQHPTYRLKPKQIKEIWEATRLISADFSFDTICMRSWEIYSRASKNERSNWKILRKEMKIITTILWFQ